MVTLHDVARRSGVTAATVSNVIRNKGAVGEATRQRVLKAIEELGYRPNLMARGLVEGKSFTLALMVENIANPFYGEVALEIERSAQEKGYHLLLYNVLQRPNIATRHLDRLLGGWVDGIIAIAGMSAAEALDIYKRGQPIVLGNWQDLGELPEAPSVDIDFYRGGYLAGQHLLSLGHRRIAAVISGDARTRTPTHAKRLEGFCQALTDAAIDLPDPYLEFGDATIESGYKATCALLELETPPTALFASNDLTALGALEAAKDKGLRLPEELSIVGLDDIALGTHVRPALTTIALSKKPFTEAIMASLMNQMERRALHQLHVTIEPYLIVRQSTAPPKPSDHEAVTPLSPALPPLSDEL